MLQTDSQDDENSDTISVTTGPQDIDYHTTKQVNITAVTCCNAWCVAPYATREGSVYAYDYSGEPQSFELFVQTIGCAIDILSFDEESSILACGERSGRVTARKVSRRIVSGYEPSWEMGGAIAVIGSAYQPHTVLKGILVSGRQCRILLSRETHCTLHATSSQDDGTWIASLDGDGQNRWFTNSQKEEFLVRISKGLFNVHAWADLRLVRSIALHDEPLFDRLAPLNHAQPWNTSRQLRIRRATPQEMPQN